MTITPQSGDPEPFLGLAALMRRVMSGEDIFELANIAAYDPNDANMLMGWAIIFQLMGRRDTGLELQGKALKMRQYYRLAGSGGQARIRLLAIARPGDMMHNTPVDFLLDGPDVALGMLYVSPELPFPASLPDHDVAMVVIAQTDENLPLLERLGQLLASSPHPVVNAPERIATLSRDGVAARLKSTPGVEIPISARICRAALERIGRGEMPIGAVLEDGGFPIIVRPVGSHGGRGLARIAEPAAIAGYLAEVPEADFYTARFVDYRGPDGLYRKARIALIDGRPFACHLALSENWMIHYKDAGMSESEAKRAEEARFMNGFDEDFGRRHREAFGIVGERLGMEYLVVDCAETADGKLLIFEADNIGFVHALDPPDQFAYKQAPMRKVFDAFRLMLEQAIERGSHPRA